MKAHDIAVELIERQLSTRRLEMAPNPGVQQAMNRITGPREPLLDFKEVAKALSVCPATVAKMCKDGLPSYTFGRSGRRRRFKMSEVEAWMKSAAKDKNGQAE